jgi:hypothetical protein
LHIYSGAADLVGLDLSLTQLEKKFSIRAVKPNKPTGQLARNQLFGESLHVKKENLCREEI